MQGSAGGFEFQLECLSAGCQCDAEPTSSTAVSVFKIDERINEARTQFRIAHVAEPVSLILFSACQEWCPMQSGVPRQESVGCRTFPAWSKRECSQMWIQKVVLTFVTDGMWREKQRWMCFRQMSCFCIVFFVFFFGLCVIYWEIIFAKIYIYIYIYISQSVNSEANCYHPEKYKKLGLLLGLNMWTSGFYVIIFALKCETDFISLLWNLEELHIRSPQNCFNYIFTRCPNYHKNK